jgi:hypothetical protein
VYKGMTVAARPGQPWVYAHHTVSYVIERHEHHKEVPYMPVVAEMPHAQCPILL